MPARLAVALFASVLAVAALCFWTLGRRATGAGPRPDAVAQEERTERAQLASPAAPEEREQRARDAVSVPPAGAEPLATPLAAEPPAAPELQRLHGVLVHSSGGRPAAGAVLVLWPGDEFRGVLAGGGRALQ